MIDYETFAKIQHLQTREGMTAVQIARELGLDARTVAYWLEQPRFRARQPAARASKLDAYKPMIKRLLAQHPFSAVQILQRLREQGYDGGVSILRDYLRIARPPHRAPAFLTLAFAPAECAQVDWGQYGNVNVGNTRRRLSFFVMVLCYSRLMYVECTVSQTMEHFLGCHLNAFRYFGSRVPKKIMVDNLKSAVLQRLTGEAPVFNPRYLDFARHQGFDIVPCNVAQGQEKGRVEAAVGYVKKNFLAGLEISDFSVLAPAVRTWLDEVANVRVHGETRQRPIDRFTEEREQLQPMAATPFDIGNIHTLRASNRFRITFETNRYSVPAEYASQRLTLKAYPERVGIYAGDKLIARHVRSYDRYRDFEDPDHPRALLAERRNARAHKALQRFLTLSAQAQHYYAELELRRFNVTRHVQKIVALSEIYGTEATGRAIEDAITFGAYSSEYIANLLDARSRPITAADGALHLTRNADLLELDLAEPDLDDYDRMTTPTDDNDDLGENT
ncbi:MAG: IS21 family transposase [Burkholderiales bacterium]